MPQWKVVHADVPMSGPVRRNSKAAPSSKKDSICKGPKGRVRMRLRAEAIMAIVTSVGSNPGLMSLPLRLLGRAPMLLLARRPGRFALPVRFTSIFLALTMLCRYVQPFPARASLVHLISSAESSGLGTRPRLLSIQPRRQLSRNVQSRQECL